MGHWLSRESTTTSHHEITTQESTTTDILDAAKQASTRDTVLSEDLETLILVRLPVKSLFRFKCVCKDWYQLFTSPYFITTHNRTYQGKKVSLFCRSYHNCRVVEGISTFSFHFSEIPMDLPLPPWLSYVRNVKIVGCCNGVVCLLLGIVLALWNPATKQFRIVPDSWNTEKYNGFCFDPDANSFKVCSVGFRFSDISNVEEESNYSNSKVNIFTPSTDSWRHVDLIVPYKISMPETSISLATCTSKYMYWDVKVKYRGKPFVKCILCLDMVDERFKRIELPPSCDRRCARLACYKDKLALFVHKIIGYDLSGDYFDVWVLNDSLGTSYYWSHEIKIAPQNDLKSAHGFFVKDGDEMAVVTINHNQYLLVDPKTQETTNFLWPKSCVEFFHYNESLLSF